MGVVAAAGTGAQEAMSLLDRWGAGVSHVVGVGGRDLTEAVDGRMAKLAVAAMRDDPGTDAILLVSKPPSERVARRRGRSWRATRRWWRRWSGSTEPVPATCRTA